MIQTIKNRLKDKKDSITVVKSYLANMTQREDHAGMVTATLDLRELQSACRELEWLLGILQQSKK